MTPAGFQQQITLLVTVNSIRYSLPSNYLKDLSWAQRLQAKASKVKVLLNSVA